MSSILEGSWFGGKPVQYFKFMRGGVSWCYTSAAEPLMLDDEEYTPAVIKRGSIRQGSERGRQNVKVEVPSNLDVAGNWRPYSPSEEVELLIRCRHRGEEDTIVEFIGRVVGPIFKGDKLELSCEPSHTNARRKGGGRKWTISCDLVLYEQGLGLCNLDPGEVLTPATIAEVGEITQTITAAGFANSPRSLTGGRIQWTVLEEVEGEMVEVARNRNIVSQSGMTLTLDAFSEELVPGLEVMAFTRPLTLEATVTAITGLTLTAEAFTEYGDGRLAGGMIKWVTAAGLTEYRTIREHVGDQVTLDYGALDLAPGLVVTAYPGCAHNWAACGQLENQRNYGGNLHMPIKNPYDGDPVW